jgi:Na+-translocating ferredoxin:NAD+ oxidoreductase subunit B
MPAEAAVELVARIDALLPQTQCTRCGYDGCLPYAQAIAAGQAPIDRCPPGGEATIAALARLLDRPVLPLDASCGQHSAHRVALIDAAVCIGCAKCLAPCPTDAIVGAAKYLHHVVANLCTGCELCIPPCPVDCITMVEDPAHPAMMDRDAARRRFDGHNARQAREQLEREEYLAGRERDVLEGR